MPNSIAIVQSDFGPMIINMKDTVIGAHVVKTGYWARDDLNIIIELIKFQLSTREKVIFYDVGANIGTHSLAVAKTFGDRVFVRSFEAQRMIFNMLCGTMAINGLLNVQCHHLAVADKSRLEIEFDKPSHEESYSHGSLELLPTFGKSDNTEMLKTIKEKVTTTTLDDLKEHVDFIKMDIEGMEDKALQGMKNLIKGSRPICFIELAKTNHMEVLDFFKESNYSGFQKIGDFVFIPKELGVVLQALPRLF